MHEASLLSQWGTGFSEPCLDVGLQHKSLSKQHKVCARMLAILPYDHEAISCTDTFSVLGTSIRTDQRVVARYTHLTLKLGALHPSRSVPVAVSFWHQSAWHCFSRVLAPQLGTLGRGCIP